MSTINQITTTTVAASCRPHDAAKMLGVSIQTLWRWVKRPDFPRSRKLSARCVVFDTSELIAWRDAQAASPSQGVSV